MDSVVVSQQGTLADMIIMPFVMLWQKTIVFLPMFIAAIAILVVGAVVASIVARAVRKVVDMTHVDEALEKVPAWQRLRSAGVTVHVGPVLGSIAYWLLVAVFLMIATDLLGLQEVSSFLQSIVAYIPQIVIAVVILAASFVVAHFTYSVTYASTTAAKITSARTIATVAQWAITVFGLLAALLQLGIAPMLINTLFTGIIAALSLALGLAFGLGGKEEAAHILRAVREKLTK